jgi:hypothetical protein
VNTARHTKLAICVPTLGDWKADFGYSLAAMCVYISAALFEEGESREAVFFDKRTSNLPRSRQEALEDALMQDCTHALFIDTDQGFPMETAHRLLAWKKPVVACNIPLKTIPSFPTARHRGPTPFGVPVYSNSSANPMGLEKVWRVGSGVMMIDLSILKEKDAQGNPKIPKPWFELRYSDKHQQFVGEDWYFCKKVEDAGFDIYIDHDLSRHISHVGNFQYTHAHIPQMAQEQAA